MADDISLYLVWFADNTVIFTILAVMVAFGISVVLILRLNSENLFTRPNAFQNLAPRKRMQTWVNPYFIKLYEPDVKGNFKDGVHLEVSSLASGCLQVFWGVEVAAVYKAMHSQEEIFYHQLSEGTFLRENCLHINDPIVLDGPGHHLLHLPTPAPLVPADLGPVPRERYPCLLVLYSLPSDSVAALDTIIANFTIIHLKDDVCRIESHIIGQYLKTIFNKVFNMQPLFMSTPYETPSDTSSTPTPPPPANGSLQPDSRPEGSESAPGDPSEEEDDNNNDVTECVVCQNAPLTHVLLPCRHACACSSCFKQLDRCPLCRGMIESYFLLSPGDSDDCEAEESSSTESLPWFEHTMERVHAWVTDTFGVF